MSAEDVDEYLRGIEEPKRGTLEALRRTILEIIPDAEQVISYKVPAFRLEIVVSGLIDARERETSQAWIEVGGGAALTWLAGIAVGERANSVERSWRSTSGFGRKMLQEHQPEYEAERRPLPPVSRRARVLAGQRRLFRRHGGAVKVPGVTAR